MPLLTYHGRPALCESNPRRGPAEEDAAVVRRSGHRPIRERSHACASRDRHARPLGRQRRAARAIRKTRRSRCSSRKGWRIGKPDVIFELPKPFNVPATGTVPISTSRIPTGFTEDKWVEAVEVQAGNPSVVHHINVYTSPPVSRRRKGSARRVLHIRRRPSTHARGRAAAVLATADVGDARGSRPGWRHAGAEARTGALDQGRHRRSSSSCTTRRTARPAQDRSRIGLIFAKQPPKERVKGVLIFNQRFTIPPGAPNHRIEARAR